MSDKDLKFKAISILAAVVLILLIIALGFDLNGILDVLRSVINVAIIILALVTPFAIYKHINSFKVIGSRQIDKRQVRLMVKNEEENVLLLAQLSEGQGKMFVEIVVLESYFLIISRNLTQVMFRDEINEIRLSWQDDLPSYIDSGDDITYHFIADDFKHQVTASDTTAAFATELMEKLNEFIIVRGENL